MITAGLVIPFDGAEADIPAGWERATEFDGMLPKHSPTGSGATSGSATHTHTDTHTHTIIPHTHTTTYAECAKGGNAKHVDNPPKEAASIHTHNSNQSGAITTTLTGSTSGGATGAGTSIPKSQTVIYIRSTGFNLIPENGVIWRQDKNTTLTEWTAANNHFLIGADAGDDAGSEVGSDNHTHTCNHTHSANHAHASATSGQAPSGGLGVYNGGNVYAGWNHTHTTYYQTANVTTPQTNLTTAETETNLPPYHELNVFKADAETPLSAGDIVITTGSVPRGWTVISQDEFYVRATTNTQLSSGGSPSHTHANISHTHNSVSHTHSASTSGPSQGRNDASVDPTDVNGYSTTSHTHPVTVSSENESFGTSKTSFGSAAMEPPTITVKYIQATASALGGGSTVYQNFM